MHHQFPKNNTIVLGMVVGPSLVFAPLKVAVTPLGRLFLTSQATGVMEFGAACMRVLFFRLQPDLVIL
ncbi:hypothetical protein GQ42DRAFT_162756 [Ramicandelaber brevisporus]|nr:hypothetical protein GQ42DRAFT_162756 [Ramicandelaber brevisporus]